MTEPPQSAPPTTGVVTMEDALRYVFFALTNQVVSDGVANELQFLRRAADQVNWKKPLTDVASVSTEGTGVPGP